MKIVGIIMLMSSSVLIGTLFSMRLAENAKRLCAIELLLTELETMIRFCALSLPQIFEKLKRQSRFECLYFLKNIDTDIGGEFDRSMMNCIKNDSCLNHEEKTVLINLCSTLGSTDIEGQTSSLELAKFEISRLLEQTRRDNPHKIRLYMCMGILVGAAVAVLMV